MRWISVVALAAFLGGGCAMRGQGKNAAYAIDGGAIAGGIVLVAAASGDACTTNDPDVYGDHTTCEIGEFGQDLVLGGAGLALVAAGLIGLLFNASINAGEEPAVTPAAAPAMTTSASCDAWIAAWKVEADPVTRTLLYRDMGESCRVQISSTGQPAR